MSNKFKVNNKDHRMTYSFSIVNFEHILQFIIIVEFSEVIVSCLRQ